MATSLELFEWHRKNDNMVLNDFDADGKLVPTSPPSPPPPGQQPQTEGPSNPLLRTLKVGKPVRYQALELELAFAAEALPSPSHKAHPEKVVDALSAGFRMKMRTKRDSAVVSHKHSISGPEQQGASPRPPLSSGGAKASAAFRKRAISGAMINSISGKEHYLQKRKELTRADLVKSSLTIPKLAGPTRTLGKAAAVVEEQISEMRADPEAQKELHSKIAQQQQEVKERVRLGQSENSVAVNVEKVKQGFYSAEVDEWMRTERSEQLEERMKRAKEKRDKKDLVAKKAAQKYYMEQREREMGAAMADEMKRQAEAMRAKLVRSREWLALLALSERMLLWVEKASHASRGMEKRKIQVDAACTIQRMFRFRKYGSMGKRFREAVMKLRNFLKNFVKAWRHRRKVRAAVCVMNFLTEVNEAPLKWVMHSFVSRVKACQRIWRGYMVCTEARIGLLKMYWESAEKVNFYNTKKELTAAAKRRLKQEADLHKDRFMLADKNEAAKRGGHSTVDTGVIKLQEKSSVIAKVKTIGNEMVLLARGKSAQGAVMKAVKDGLEADITRAKKAKASAEVKTEFCTNLLAKKRHEYRRDLKPFEDRQRERELAMARELTPEDARELFLSGKDPAQLMANVSIASGNIDDQFLYNFGFNSDDAFKMMSSIPMEEMCEVVQAGLKESEAQKWAARHGLDKHGRPKANSVYVVEGGEDDEAAERRARMRVVAKEKARLRDMKDAMEDLEGGDAEAQAMEDFYRNKRTAEFAFIDSITGNAEEEMHNADVIVEQSKLLEEGIKYEDAVHSKADPDLLARFRIVPDMVLKNTHEKVGGGASAILQSTADSSAGTEDTTVMNRRGSTGRNRRRSLEGGKIKFLSSSGANERKKSMQMEKSIRQREQKEAEAARAAVVAEAAGGAGEAGGVEGESLNDKIAEVAPANFAEPPPGILKGRRGSVGGGRRGSVGGGEERRGSISGRRGSVGGGRRGSVSGERRGSVGGGRRGSMSSVDASVSSFGGEESDEEGDDCIKPLPPDSPKRPSAVLNQLGRNRRITNIVKKAQKMVKGVEIPTHGAKKTEEVVVGVPKGAWEKQGEGGGGGKPLMHSIQQQAMIKRKQTFMKMKSRTSSM